MTRTATALLGRPRDPRELSIQFNPFERQPNGEGRYDEAKGEGGIR
jgi:hypothetical protein